MHAAPINRSTDSVQIGGNDSNNSITTEGLLEGSLRESNLDVTLPRTTNNPKEQMVRYLGNSVTDDLSANAKSSITLAKLLKRKALHRIEELQPHAETDLSKEDLDSVVKNNQKI